MNFEGVCAVRISGEEYFDCEFSICTLVTNMDEYQGMLTSFLNSGFTSDFCEYLYVDNTQGNTFDAFSAINKFIRISRGQYIILCHQDILINIDDCEHLKEQIRQLTRKDSNWAVIGNAGGLNLKLTAFHLNHGDYEVLREPLLPLKAISLDENFLVVRKQANLAVSRDLSGFHMYGTDICLVANLLGYTTYVVDFKLQHNSRGKIDSSFFKLKRDIIKKYRRAFSGRFMGTTITRFYISGNVFGSFLFNTSFLLFWARQLSKLLKKKSQYFVS